MRALIQRALSAKVVVDERTTGEIAHGLVVLLGVEDSDAAEEVEWITGKIANMRIFPDEEGRMNRSVVEVGGGILLISQFTLFASTRKGNRPSFLRAGKPDYATAMMQQVAAALSAAIGRPVAQGEFGAHMDVALTNSGPVTIWIDTKNRE